MRPEAATRIAVPLAVCGLINVAAYFQAKGFDALVAGVLQERTPSTSPIAAPADYEARPLHGTSADGMAEAFDSSRRRAKASRRGFEAEVTCQGVRASLIAASDDPSWSFVSLTTPDAPPLLRRVGDEIAGRTVLAIRRDRVVLGVADASCDVRLGGPVTVEAAGRTAPADPTSPTSPSLIEKIADGDFVVDRAAIAQLLADPMQALGRIRVQPDARGGLRVRGIRPGSPLAAFGLRDGDVVKSVGGQDLVDPASSVATLARLAAQDRAEFVIERDGQSKTLRITLR